MLCSDRSRWSGCSIDFLLCYGRLRIFGRYKNYKLKRVINLLTSLSLSSNLIASRAFLSMHMRTTAAGMGVLIVGALLLALGGASESREIRNTLGSCCQQGGSQRRHRRVRASLANASPNAF
jgi:hypothetical protein